MVVLGVLAAAPARRRRDGSGRCGTTVSNNSDALLPVPGFSQQGYHYFGILLNNQM